MSLFRRSLGAPALARRLYSAPAVAVDVTAFEYSKVAAPSTTPKVFTVATTSASDQYTRSLTDRFAASSTPGNSSREKVLGRLHSLVKNRQFSYLLNTFLSLTAPNAATSWSSVLTKDQISFFLSKIVDYQITVLVSAARLLVSNRPGEASQTQLSLARELKDGIRRVYSNLLLEDPQDHIYTKKNRNGFPSSAFELTITDYENLINLELHNAKLDLASKWFQRLENQLGDPKTVMSPALWTLKLKVQSGAVPFLWKVPSSELYENRRDPRRSKLVSETSWLPILQELLEMSLKNASLVIGEDFVCALIHAMGYSNSLSQLTQHIENIWGIKTDGTLSDSFTKLQLDDPLFPTVGILRAIVLSLSYNHEFFQAMTYVNRFQEVYKDEIDLTGPDARNFWTQAFKYCDNATRFTEDRALAHYIKKNAEELWKSKAGKITLEEAQNSLLFDYDGYLTYMNGLKTRRRNAVSQMWNLYLDNNGFFLPELYKRYLLFLGEEKNDQLFFQLLELILKNYHYYKVSGSSFNKKHMNMNDTQESAYSIYTLAIKTLISHKAQAGLLEQIEPLIREWALDHYMQEDLLQYCERKSKKWQRILDDKEEKLLREQNGENDEDLFLGIMS